MGKVSAYNCTVYIEANGRCSASSVITESVRMFLDYWTHEEWYSLDRFDNRRTMLKADSIMEFASNVALTCVNKVSTLGYKPSLQPCTYCLEATTMIDGEEKTFVAKGKGLISEILPSTYAHAYRIIMTGDD